MLRVFALSLFSATAAADRESALLQLESLLARTLRKRVAPTVDLASITVRGAPGVYTPTVLMHGLGDAGSNAGMQSLAQSVETAYPGAYATAVNVANTVSADANPLAHQKPLPEKTHPNPNPTPPKPYQNSYFLSLCLSTIRWMSLRLPSRRTPSCAMSH